MSKERDALKKAIGIINFTHPNTWHEFISEVQELLAQPEQDNTQYLLDQVARLTAENAMLKEKWLAQPEQTEQEPVAWMWDEMFCDDWTTVSSPAVKKPSKSKYVANVRPLYTSPPKREPLSEKEIIEGNPSMLNVTREIFINGVQFAEKMHGIGGGE